MFIILIFFKASMGGGGGGGGETCTKNYAPPYAIKCVCVCVCVCGCCILFLSAYRERWNQDNRLEDQVFASMQ